MGRAAYAGPDRPEQSDRRAVRAKRLTLAFVAMVSLFLLWSRCTRLNTSLWNDEAYTVTTFIDRGPITMLFGYFNPNNHLLFSLLSWTTTNIVGKYETAYRIWSVVPGLVAVAVVSTWAWRRLQPLVGATVIVLACMSSVHLELTPQARGYGLGFLAGAGMLVAAVRVIDRGATRDLVLVGGFATMGIWTLPQLSVAFVAHAAVLLALRRDLWRQIVATATAVTAACLVLYAPVLDQLVTGSQNDYGLPPLPWLSWINGPYSHLARPTLEPFLPDPLTRGPWLVALYLILGTLGIRWLWRRGEQSLLLLLVAPPILTYLSLVIARVGFASRYSSFLLFHVLVLLALGVAELCDLAHPRTLKPLFAAVAAGLILVAAHNVVDYTQLLPYEDAKRVKQIVDASGIDGRVFTNSTRPVPLQFYFGAKRLTTPADLAASGFLPRWAWPGWAVEQFCNLPEAFAYVDHESPRVSKPDVSCLVDRGATHVYVPGHFRGAMNVWLVPAL